MKKGESLTKKELISELDRLRKLLKKAEKQEIVRRQAEEVAHLQRDLALALSATGELEEALRLCLETAIQAARMDSGGIYLVDEETGDLDFVRHQGLSAQFVAHVSYYDREAVQAQLVMKGHPIYTVYKQLRTPQGRIHLEEGLRAIAVIPIQHEGKVIACLNVASHVLPKVPVAARKILETIAAQIGSAIARVRAQEALRRSENKYRAFMDFAGDAIVLADTSGRIMEINKKAEELFGYRQEELIGQNITVLHPPPGKKQTQAEFNKIMAHNNRQSIEINVLCKDGKVVPTDLSGCVIEHEGEKVLQGIFRDISPRKQAEEALKASEEQFKIIVEHLPLHIGAVDISGKFIIWNKYSERMLGYTAEEAIGRMTANWIHVSPEAAQEVSEITARNGFYNHENVFVHKDGSRIPVQLVVLPKQNVLGEVVGFYGIALDITDRKQSEEKLARQRDALEEMVKDLQAFSYSISHDLKTPVFTIEGYGQLLLEGLGARLNEDEKYLVERILSSCQYMRNLIEGLLKLTQFSEQNVERQEVDLSELSCAIADEWCKQDPERRVHFEIAPRLTVRGDTRLLRVVMENLIGNAWKFSSRNALTMIEIGGLRQAEETVYFVRDNGVGFDMAYADKIFNIFERLHPQLEFEGAGIGLAATQRIVQRHGGRIWAESTPGAGATFYFTLPYRHPDAK